MHGFASAPQVLSNRKEGYTQHSVCTSYTPLGGEDLGCVNSGVASSTASAVSAAKAEWFIGHHSSLVGEEWELGRPFYSP